MNKKRRKTLKTRKWIFALIIPGMFIIGIILWMFRSYDYRELAKNALKSNEQIVVNNDDYIVFTPKDVNKEIGFIFYPGAKVEPESYAPLCKKISEAGYTVVIVPMPLNFAIFDSDKGKNVIERFPEIETWAIGGHSLGGVMACKYAMEEPKIQAIALYASYPQGDELKDTNKKIVTIWGDKDGVANIDKVKEAALPEDTTYVEINGGNHAQFGDYGDQKSDNKADISGEEQVEIAAKATIDLLNSLE